MITVTRLDGTRMIVNSDQIAWIEFIPDTVLALVGGEKLIVREAPGQIVEQVTQYKRIVLGTDDGRAFHLPLGIVDGGDER